MFEPLSPSELSALFLSLKVALIAIIGAVPPAIMCSYALAKWRFPGHSLLNVVVHLPLVLPPVVTGYYLLLIFGRTSFIGAAIENCCGIRFAFRWTGAALAAGIMAFPLLVRSIRLSIDAVDDQLEMAARGLGATGIDVFLSITLPLSYPGILAGAVLGFAKALGEFGATITFVSNIPGETQTLPSAIYAYIQSPSGEIPALRLAGLAVLVSFGALFISERFVRRGNHRRAIQSHAYALNTEVLHEQGRLKR